jgi:hypothetical protein
MDDSGKPAVESGPHVPPCDDLISWLEPIIARLTGWTVCAKRTCTCDVTARAPTLECFRLSEMHRDEHRTDGARMQLSLMLWTFAAGLQESERGPGFVAHVTSSYRCLPYGKYLGLGQWGPYETYELFVSIARAPVSEGVQPPVSGPPRLP